MTWKPWIRDAVDPTPEEVARVRTGFDKPLLREWRDATAPTDAEVRTFLAGREVAEWRIARRRRRTVQVAVGFGATVFAAAAALFVATLPPAYGPVPVALGEPQELIETAPLRLGPSIEVIADAELVVAEAGAGGTVVDLVEGRGVFEVDPTGQYRHLVVRAGDTEVEVRGTRFVVEHVAGHASVEVLRGRVEVRHAGVVALLGAGQAWSEPMVAVAAAPAAIPLPGEPDVGPPPEVVGAIHQMRPATPRSPVVETRAAPVEAPLVKDTLAMVALEARIAAHESAETLLPDLARFIDAYPHSPYRQKAELLRFDLRGDHDPAAAVVEMDAWMKANPSSPVWMSVAEVRAKTAQRRLGDPALALPTWRVLAGQPGMRGAEAAANQGLCALEVGLDDEARTALRLALAREVPEPLRSEVLAAMAGRGWKAGR